MTRPNDAQYDGCGVSRCMTTGVDDSVTVRTVSVLSMTMTVMSDSDDELLYRTVDDSDSDDDDDS